MDKKHLLYAFVLGLLISDLAPTPADPFFFSQQRKNKEALETGKITAKQYWQRDALNYYLINAGWWLLVLLLVVYTGKDYAQKRNILLALIAGGAVIAVIHKNIKKDEEFYRTHKIVETV
jgi:Na+/H+ antiporter NhaD/arsenite permease-like protein